MAGQHLTGTSIICVHVELTPDVLGPVRTPAQMLVFQDKIRVHLFDTESKVKPFEIHRFTVKILPNLDTLIIIGWHGDIKDNVYIFLYTKTARDNCVATMRLLGFQFLDEYNAPIVQPSLKLSRSLPTMLDTVHEYRES